jgi:hypothetical protein
VPTTRRKVVISGSVALRPRIEYWRGHFEDRGFEVTAVPEPWDESIGFEGQLGALYRDFYSAVRECDVFFSMNEDRHGVEGYLGASATAELTYAVVLNLVENRGIDILLAKPPGSEVFAFDELTNYVRAGWVGYYAPD